jgi:hypothetical protein
LYMILSRYLHLDNHSPSLTIEDSLTLTTTETLDSTADLSGRPVKGQWIKNNKIARIALLLWCLFGASAVMADGLLTPAVSVISAVTGKSHDVYLLICVGIAVPAPTLNSSIVPISIAILVVLVFSNRMLINGCSSLCNNSVLNTFRSSSLLSSHYGSQLFLLPA